MVVCAPATQCCCGCSLTFGTKMILFGHFAFNVLVVLQVAGLIIFQWFGREAAMSTDLHLQLFAAGFALAGLPIIFMAFLGTLKKVEATIRLYLLYFLASFVLDMIAVYAAFPVLGACSKSALPGIVSVGGKSWACGMARILNTSVIALTVLAQLYIFFIVLSFCQDLSEGGGPEIGDLACSEKALQYRVKKQDPYTMIVNMEEHEPAEYGSMYDAVAVQGLADLRTGSNRIFRGTHHEMAYPPPEPGRG